LLDHRDLDPQLTTLLGASHWYVGYSGGVDSTALLHLLHQWCCAHETAPGLSALHINHGLHHNADDWQRHCEDLCRSLDRPLSTLRVDVPVAGSVEQAAREARYRAFAGQLQPGALLFLGHHLDDQVETFFLRLLRGAGVEGLAAMPRRRPLGAGELVRPLLAFIRDQLEDYVLRHQLVYVEDPSNRNTGMARNFLRREALPLLAARWPAYRQAVARASGHLASAARALADAPETVRSVMGDPGVPLDALVGPAPEEAARHLRAWLRARGCRAPDRALLAEFLRQVREAAGDGGPKMVCGDYSLQRFRDAVYLLPAFDAPPPPAPCELAPGDRRDIPGIGTVSLEPAGAAGLQLGEGEHLTLRWRRGGERCRLPGRTGSHSLKALLQELQVPPWWRDRIPLVYLGEELLAIGELLQCASGRWGTPAPSSAPHWCVHWESCARWPGSD